MTGAPAQLIHPLASGIRYCPKNTVVEFPRHAGHGNLLAPLVGYGEAHVNAAYLPEPSQFPDCPVNMNNVKHLSTIIQED